MEATAAARGGSMPPMPQAQARKQWRAVSDHHSARNIGDEVVIYLKPLALNLLGLKDVN